MKQQILEGAAYICIGIAIALVTKYVYYATDTFAYIPTAGIFLAAGLILALFKLMDKEL